MSVTCNDTETSYFASAFTVYRKPTTDLRLRKMLDKMLDDIYYHERVIK